MTSGKNSPTMPGTPNSTELIKMEAILHITGLCSDNHSHVDVMDLLLGGTSFGLIVYYAKTYINTLIYIVKDYIKPKK